MVEDAKVDAACICSEFATSHWPLARRDMFGEAARAMEAPNVQITIAGTNGRAATLSK
jgi:hypothetical protein